MSEADENLPLKKGKKPGSQDSGGYSMSSDDEPKRPSRNDSSNQLNYKVEEGKADDKNSVSFCGGSVNSAEIKLDEDGKINDKSLDNFLLGPIGETKKNQVNQGTDKQ